MDTAIQASSEANGRRPRRSAVTSGKRLHVKRPGDNAWSRRFRDVLEQIVNDAGGPEVLSEGQRQIARRCATLSVECERLEGKALAGEEIDLDLYGQMTDRLGRALQRLGLKRVTRNALLPDLHAYIDGKATEVDA